MLFDTCAFSIVQVFATDAKKKYNVLSFYQFVIWRGGGRGPGGAEGPGSQHLISESQKGGNSTSSKVYLYWPKHQKSWVKMYL
jgi:hypothetical protein